MYAGRNNRRRQTRVARVMAWGLLGCIASSLAASAAVAQPSRPIPVLTVPTGAPPEPAGSTVTIQEAVSAALQAAGSAPPGIAPAPGAPAIGAPAAPRVNPFATQAAPPGGQNMLLPFNPGHAAENIKVNDDHDGLISLAVREGSLRQVVSMIAETQKLNIVFAGPSDSMISATFERQPWQTVLDALLTSSGHTWTTRGDVIFVSSIELAEFMPPDAGGQQVQIFELDFTSAIDIDQTIKGLLSPAGRSWVTESDSLDNRRTKEAVAVVDYPAYVARIGQYICQADQPPRQVNVQAHILQIELTDDCRNGINFNNIIRMSSTPISLKSIGFANESATNAFMVDVTGDGVNGLDGLIELLQTTTDAKTLARPEIHAVNGQASRIQIGEKLPYRVTTTTQTATLESVQMLDVGVVLEVTPRITRDGHVLMRIKPKVSTGVISAETGLPSEKTSEVETDVMLASGQGMVIGGLIQEVDSNVQTKLPWFGDIPYLGVLFQKRQVVKSRKEIIVTLRPFVVPFTPALQEAQDEKVFRSEQPLTQGAICRNPRPYEPRMPDTFALHDKKKEAGRVPAPDVSYSDGELIGLPPVEDVFDQPVEELPPGAPFPSDAQLPAMEPANP